jgi:gamma-D-glutamyl-L-lysine dipeptidyl-peptidase
MALDFGVCRLTLVPVFEKPDYQSRQHNQLLFGEAYEVTGKKGEWLSILTAFDSEGGWISAAQHHSISQEYFDQIISSDYKITTDVVGTLLYNKNPLTVVMGSILPISNSELFKVEEQLAFNGDTKSMSQKRDADFLKPVLNKFINAPFVPGGKTPFGTDAMGFIQMAFKIAGHKLPRTVDQLNRVGTTINNLASATLGDLVILKPFNNADLVAAILLTADKALLADGFVQAFSINERGIKAVNQKKYNWEIVSVRRVF